jgi:hypothetical protein
MSLGLLLIIQNFQQKDIWKNVKTKLYTPSEQIPKAIEDLLKQEHRKNYSCKTQIITLAISNCISFNQDHDLLKKQT